MNKLLLLSRLTLLSKTKRGRLSQTVRPFSDKDDEDNPEKQRSKAALIKLKNLLKTMVEEDKASQSKAQKLDLARPTNKRKKQPGLEKEHAEDEPKSPAQIAEAVRTVAETLGGDVKKTESELLMKLLNPADIEQQTITNLSDIIKGMKIDRETKSETEQSRAQQVKQVLRGVRKTDTSTTKTDFIRKPRSSTGKAPGPELVLEKIDLFGAEPLGIFTADDNVSEGPQNQTWDRLYKRELKLAVTHPPSNYFQQMILWTDQGKVWKFPIDNEQGLEKEQSVYFADHVFLEQHLESWCPSKGPLRHFMELVCVGLSKNPYLTVEAKKEHIDWFRKYFDSKKQLLSDVGALQGVPSGDAKQIDQ